MIYGSMVSVSSVYVISDFRLTARKAIRTPKTITRAIAQSPTRYVLGITRGFLEKMVL
jgi:hypothetical protein